MTQKIYLCMQDSLPIKPEWSGGDALVDGDARWCPVITRHSCVPVRNRSEREGIEEKEKEQRGRRHTFQSDTEDPTWRQSTGKTEWQEVSMFERCRKAEQGKCQTPRLKCLHTSVYVWPPSVPFIPSSNNAIASVSHTILKKNGFWNFTGIHMCSLGGSGSCFTSNFLSAQRCALFHNVWFRSAETYSMVILKWIFICFIPELLTIWIGPKKSRNNKI